MGPLTLNLAFATAPEPEPESVIVTDGVDVYPAPGLATVNPVTAPVTTPPEDVSADPNIGVKTACVDGLPPPETVTVIVPRVYPDPPCLCVDLENPPSYLNFCCSICRLKGPNCKAPPIPPETNPQSSEGTVKTPRVAGSSGEYSYISSSHACKINS